ESPQTEEEADLLALVRLIRRQRSGQVRPIRHRRRRWTAFGLVATIALVMVSLVVGPWSRNADIVMAMEQAVAALHSYHGVLEKRTINADGETWPVHRVEIWWEDGRYMTRDEHGVITVNNGERRWQVRPDEGAVLLLPA